MSEALVDTPDAAALQQLAQVLRDATESGAGCYALLDMMFAPTPVPDALAAGGRERLYRDRYSGEGLETVEPQLIRLSHLDEDSLGAFSTWCTGQPMLSFIVSKRDLPSLATHLRDQAEAVDPAGTGYMLRWADTRCLATLPDIFTDEQMARLMQHIDAWFYFDRAGRVQRLPGHAPAAAERKSATTPEPLAQPYLLSEAQIEAINEAGRVDMLMSFMRSQPQLYGAQCGQPSERHAAATQALSEAQANGETHQGVLLRRLAQALSDAGLLKRQ